MTTSDWERQQKPQVTGEKTQCKVHQLLECQQKARQGRKLAALNKANGDKPVEKNSMGSDPHHDEFFSRMMTKRQLNEMALGVRDLSKRLGKVTLKIDVKTVFLLTKIVDKEVIKETRKLTGWLLSKEQKTPYIVYVIPSARLR